MALHKTSLTPAALVAVLLLAGPASGQEFSRTFEGTWRIEGPSEGGVLTFGRGSGGGLVYERRARRDLSQRVRVERGTARLQGGWLHTEEESSRGLSGGLSGVAPNQPWRGRYRLRAGSLVGQRARAGASASERLVRLRASEQAGNELTLLLDGDAFRDLRAHLGAAERTIDVQAYAWADDDTGRSVARVLMAKARAGVRVRCLIDIESRFVTYALGERDVTRGLHRELREAGVEVIVQNGYGRGIARSILGVGRSLRDSLRRLTGRAPLPPRERRGFRDSDHCKLIVIDGRTAYVGGQNLATVNERDWRGQQVRIDGPAAHEVLRLFVQHWKGAGGQATLPPAPPAGAGDVPAEVLVRTPGLQDGIAVRMLAEIRRARRRIVIGTPQFGDEAIQGALIEAAARGVRVIVIVPDYASDPQWVTREVLVTRQNALIEAGVELFGYEAKTYDVKAAAFDGEVSILGSAPFNGKRMDEVMLCVPDARFTRELESRLLVPDFRGSVRLQPLERSLWRKLKGRLYRRLNRAL